MAKKGTPEYDEWLRKYREKRKGDTEDEETGRKRRQKVKAAELFTPEQMETLPDNLLPKGAKGTVYSKSHGKNLAVEVVRYSPTNKKYLVSREDRKFLYYSADEISLVGKEKRQQKEKKVKVKDSVSIVPEGSKSARIEEAVKPVTYDMMVQGMQVDKEELAKFKAEYTKRLEETKAKMFELAGGEFNFLSPSATAKVLYDEQGLPRVNGNSTSAETLSKLTEITDSELPKLISQARSENKIIVSYLDKFERLSKLGDGAVRNNFETSTVSGRFATSYNPVLVEVPESTITENKVYFKEDLDEIGLGNICPLR